MPTIQNNQQNKILSEDFTLGFVKYLLESTKTWEEGYQLIKLICFGLDIKSLNCIMAVKKMLASK